MKCVHDCYFFRAIDGGVYVDISETKEPIHIPVNRMAVTLKNEGKEIHSIRDMGDGTYYYPAGDGAEIQ